MLALGIILLAVAVGGGVLVAWASSAAPQSTVTLWGQSVAVSPLHTFVAGIVAALLAIVSVKLIAAGSRRASARRRELRELRAQSTEPAPSTSPEQIEARAPGTERPEAHRQP